MRESILTIPINEIFEETCGCPICRLRDMLEFRTIDYIMGAAMMEPDVRLETNRLGFCRDHLRKMEQGKNRLSLALMLQTRLEELKKTAIPKKLPAREGLFSFKKKDDGDISPSNPPQSCFVCEKIDWGMERLLATFFTLAVDDSFLPGLQAQEYICIPHFQLLCRMAPDKLPKKQLDKFYNNIKPLAQRALETLYDDVSHYCSMYDYRNSGKDADWGNSKDSIERAIPFIS